MSISTSNKTINTSTLVEQQNNEIFELSDLKVLLKKPTDWITPLGSTIPHRPFKKLLRTDIRGIFESKGIIDPDLEAREIVGQVFPFKINQHLVDQINWNNYQQDPLFQLTFPQKEMLFEDEINEVINLKRSNASREVIADKISEIRNKKNPAPANQSANRPFIDDDNEPEFIDGLQHKYKKIVLMFHKNAQTCHAYCTYCFRFLDSGTCR